MAERDFYIGFSMLSGIGPHRFKLLLDYFGSAQKAWQAKEDTLLELGLSPKLTYKLVKFRNNFSAQAFEKELLVQHIKIITRIDSEFPSSLLHISDPPIALYVKGELPKDDIPRLAVVGTRKPTSYGRQVTEKLTRELALSGVVIISGMARGVDGLAHQACLAVKGRTIAVLGCGVDIIYPPEHKNLYVDIINQGGAVISEVPPGHTVLKGLFPSRNRIISGLSLGIVVTEGAQDSGSLITARYAAEQGREVFAVPGPINSYLSVGPAKLIKQGAKIVTEVTDILEELNLKLSHSVVKRSLVTDISKRKLNPNEQKVVKILSGGAIQYDELVRVSGMSVASLAVLLSSLELSGIIQNLGNGKYSLK